MRYKVYFSYVWKCVVKAKERLFTLTRCMFELVVIAIGFKFYPLQMDTGIEIFDKFPIIISSGIIYFLVAMGAIFIFRLLFIAPFLLWKAAHEEIEILKNQIQSSIVLIDDGSILPSIIFGRNFPYENTEQKLGDIVSVAIKNNRVKHALLDCKLELLFKKTDGQFLSWSLTEKFNISLGKEKYIKVACYEKSANMSSIRIFVHDGAYYHYSWEMPPADRKNVIILKLTAEENIVVEEHCYLWIDEEGKLRLEKI